MSMTLGEKLRQAREARGFTLSEVAEQTRISALYLESIEHDDYGKLPGGIFNKGFVKSYAKFVGVNEQEALTDYSALMARADLAEEAELKLYKPEVLTDDRSGPSMMPTIIIAAVILGIMTVGVLLLVNYLRRPADDVVVNPPSRVNTNASPDVPTNTEAPPGDVPEMATLKVEFKAISAPVSLAATNDGKMSTNVVTPGTAATFEPKESLKLSYSRSLANAVELTINGRKIALPSAPLNPKRNAIEFEITKDNLAQIWATGSISTEVPAAQPDANANSEPSGETPVTAPTTPRPTPAARPSVAPNPANTPAKTPEPRPAASPRPVTTPARPPANN